MVREVSTLITDKDQSCTIGFAPFLSFHFKQHYALILLLHLFKKKMNKINETQFRRYFVLSTHSKLLWKGSN